MNAPVRSDFYSIERERGSGLVIARLVGFWAGETIEQFERDLLTFWESLETPGKATDLRFLVDLRQFPVQSKATNDRLGQLIDRLPNTRHAVLLPEQMLSKMQSDRIGKHSGERSDFREEAEARAWLASGS